jgi:acetyl esterase/lipase
MRDIAYVTNGHERQKLDLFLPGAPATARPLVVWIHGGGWEQGSKNGGPGRALLNQGYAVASIGYRLSQHAVYPAQIEDCKAAIRFLRANAGEYGIDPARIGVWGASAGGHLAALLGTTGNIRTFDVGEHLDQSSAVQCVLDWFGPTDFLHYGEPPMKALDYPRSVVSRLLGGTIRGNPEKARAASPFYFVHPKAAPFLIMQGDQDPLVPLQQSERLDGALREAGVESHLEVLPGAKHGGSEFTSAENVRLMGAFFERHLGARSASAEQAGQ